LHPQRLFLDERTFSLLQIVPITIPMFSQALLPFPSYTRVQEEHRFFTYFSHNCLSRASILHLAQVFLLPPPPLFSDFFLLAPVSLYPTRLAYTSCAVPLALVTPFMSTVSILHLVRSTHPPSPPFVLATIFGFPLIPEDPHQRV